MKKYIKIISIVAILSLWFIPSTTVLAGNEDRSGSAGAGELLINPWTRSSGWGGANSGCIRGLEAIQYNVAGLAFTPKTELLFARTNYFQGTGIHINAAGLSQKVGESGVIGLSFTSMTFGDIMITTTSLPEGGIGTFSPTLSNINLSYAKAFSNSIFGGVNLKVVSENIANMKAQGIALDAGIQYVTGKKENIKFGVSMKNVGPRMKYSGDGLTFRGYVPGADNQMTLSQRSAEFELPSLINIGAAYDILVEKKEAVGETPDKKNEKSKNNVLHRVTLAGNFTSNSFTKDQFCVGAEYSLKNLVMVRGGFVYEKGLTKIDTRTTVLSGPTAGFTVEVPLGKDKTTTFGLDYSYRVTNALGGIHAMGARINL